MYKKVGAANPNESDLTTLYLQLTSVVYARNELVEAESFAREAHVRFEKLCSTPEGRTAFRVLLAKAKNNLGEVLRARVNAARAESEKLLADALELSRGK